MSRLTDEQTIQVRINTAVDEAISANNEKWREKINKIPDNIYSRLKCGHSPMIVLATVRADIETLLSQMEEE